MTTFIQPDNSVAALSEYTDQKRLSIYKMITSACSHLYSKGKLQEDKFMAVAKVFADLAVHDPIFMAHLTAWAANKDSKDLKTLSIFFNALNDANGTPFFKGASKNKPNYREVSYALLQTLDPHLALRVLQLCHKKFEVSGVLNNSRHFPTGMKTAFKKYLFYREDNANMLRGIKSSGLSKKMRNIYRLSRTAPSDVAASILGWKQKDGRSIQMQATHDFTNKTPQQIVEELTKSKLSPVVAMSLIPSDKMTASVAKAMLSNCSGNQSIILYNWFSRNGFLDVPEIKELFKDKIKQSTTAIDRIDTLTKNAAVEDKKEMAAVRSEKRKVSANTESLGKIYMHIDASGSMHQSIEFAKEKACIFAECVSNPAANFRWGRFGTRGEELPVPSGFTKEDFHMALYGKTADMGSTDCIALYGKAREFGADIDVYVTDQGHIIGTISKRINEYHAKNPNAVKPKAAVIVDFSGNRDARVLNLLHTELLRCEIPVAIIKPEALSESALVAQSINAALMGEVAIIQEILDTKLPTLPRWWGTIEQGAKNTVLAEVPVNAEAVVEKAPAAKKPRKKASKSVKNPVRA